MVGEVSVGSCCFWCWQLLVVVVVVVVVVGVSVVVHCWCLLSVLCLPKMRSVLLLLRSRKTGLQPA